MEPDKHSHAKKRKHKKSFIQRAKKHCKKGNHGKGSYLDEDTFQYFLRVLDVVQENNFTNEEDKAVFVNNVFEATRDQEVNYSSNQFVSVIFQKLLPQASDETLKRFFNAFGNDLRPNCSDPYASHVLQTLLLIATARVEVSDVKSEDDTPSDHEQWVLKVGRFMLNNLEDFVWDTYANHIIRTVVECLGGISSVENGTNCKNPTQSQAKLKNCRKVPASFTELLKEFIHRLSSWPQFSDLAYNNLTSGLLQSLLFATKASSKKETKKLISQLLDDCFTRVGENSKKEDGVKNKKKISDDPQILAVFENVAAAHLLEAALSVAEKKSLTQIYARCFINQMVLLSKTSSSNFAVQRLLDNCSQKEEFDEMYNEMENHLEEILASGNTGVLLSLATGCRRLVTKQGSFQQSLMKALHCFEPNERQSQLAPLTLRLQTFEQQDSDNIRIHLHGSLILQALLYFNKPIKTVDSIVEMKQADLVKVFTDPKGSHVMDAFMKSNFIGEKSRINLIKKLEKKYVALACSKHGSRSLDAIWEAASLKHKCMIMDDLANNSAILNSDQFGSIISSKYNLSLYTHRKEDWKDAQKKENRTKELFADIIGDAKK